MSDQNNRHLPKKLIQGGTNRSQEAKPPQLFGSGGQIDTNSKWADIKWTPKKLGLVIAFLSIPYIIAIISTIKSGNPLMTMILISLAIFVGSLYWLLRWIEQADLD